MTVTESAVFIPGSAPRGPTQVRCWSEVAIPPHILPNVINHLERFSEPRPDGPVFVGPRGGVLSSATFGADVWRPAVASLGSKGFTFHGLRGVSATLAARQGATTKELMRRLEARCIDRRHGDEIPTSRDCARSGARQRDERGGNGAFRTVSKTGNGSAVRLPSAHGNPARRGTKKIADAAGLRGLMQQCLDRHRQNPVSAMPMSWGLQKSVSSASSSASRAASHPASWLP